MRAKSIGRKLSAAVALAVFVSSVVTFAVSAYGGIEQYWQFQREALLAVGSAFSSAIAEPLAAHDRDRVFSALRGIGQVPHLLEATVRDSNGDAVVTLGAAARLESDTSLARGSEASLLQVLASRTISIVVPVKQNGKTIGRIEILRDASDLLSSARSSLTAILLGSGLALLVGLIVASQLQRAITRPLRQLTKIMARVQETRDYSVSLPPAPLDEVGVLMSSFNSMISDIKERDDQLVRHRERLEQDVADRTQDLDIARRAAEEANSAKSTFLATMSHEIRTPLTGLLVMSELLVSSALPLKASRYAEVALKSGKTLLSIINDILDFSKIEAGKLVVESARVDLREIITTIVTLYIPRALEKGVDLAARIDPRLPATFLSDPVRLQQIVSNLVNNALKFTERGHVLIDVVFLDDGDMKISVQDTGIGIAPGKLDKIFDAFTQAEDSTARRFGGTGLGLSISRRLADALGGSLCAESQLGAGSAFNLLVPLKDVTDPPICPQAPRDGMRALIKVGGLATRVAAESMLRQMGLSVHSLSVDEEFPDGSFDLLVHYAAHDATREDLSRFSKVVKLSAPAMESLDNDPSADLVVTLPLTLEDASRILRCFTSNGAQPSDRATGPRPAYPLYLGARVLVVDDTAVNREIMVEALARFGVTPTLASNGLEALAVLDGAPFDLVFMDGSMPELDGFEATRRLRTLERAEARPRTPVIALTAHVVGSAAQAWRDSGMDGVLYKPFNLKELENALAPWLKREREHGSSQEEPASPPTLLDAAEALLDPGTLADMMAIDKGAGRRFVHRVFALYLTHAPQALESLRLAVDSSDFQACASAAHALKSMSLNIGARRVAHSAAILEARARADRIEESSFASLVDALAATLNEIERQSAPLTPDRTAEQRVATLNAKHP